MSKHLSQKKFISLLAFSFLALNFVSFSSQVSLIIGTDGIIPLLASGAVMFLFSVLLIKVMLNGGGKSFYEILTEELGKIAGSCVYFIYILTMIYLYSYAVRIICTQINVYMLKNMNMVFIEMTFILTTAYAAVKGFTPLGNFSRIFLYPIVFVLTLLFVLCINNMDILNMLPLFTNHPAQYLTASMHLISYNFSGVFAIPFIINKVYDPDGKILVRKLFYVFLAVTAIFCAYYILCIGVLGVDTCRSIVFPAINIMHNSTSSGILLNRYEIIIVFVVVILFFLYSAMMLSATLSGTGQVAGKAVAYIFSGAGIILILHFLNDRSAGEYIAKVLHMRGYLAYVPLGMIVILSYILLRRKLS